MKAHVFKFLYVLFSDERFWDLRDRLGDKRCVRIETTEEIVEELKARLEGMGEVRRHCVMMPPVSTQH